MILKDALRKVVELQKQELIGNENIIPRNIQKIIDTKSRHAIIISGVRRSGKSTLLRQIMHS